MYNITPYSYKQAKKYNVKIQPSSNKKYKIDVYDNDDTFLTSIGAIGYNDYPSYIESHGIDYANERRRLYYIRHKNDDKLKGMLSKVILW
jgi:hypothetical protein